MLRGLTLVGLLLSVIPWFGPVELQPLQSPEFMIPCVFVTFSLMLCSLPATINFLYRRELQFDELIDRKQPTHEQKVWLLRIHRICMLASGGLLAAGLVWYRVYCYATSALDTIERVSIMMTMILAWLAYQSHLSTLLKYLFAAYMRCSGRRPGPPPMTVSASQRGAAMKRSRSIPTIALSATRSTLELHKFIVELHQDKQASDALDAFALDDSIV
jgi:hypothetical protein